jgi:hypothetical protein
VISLSAYDPRDFAALAMLYRATGRDAESERAIQDLLRVSPEGDGPRLAKQLWAMFGEPENAAVLKTPGKRR